MRTSVKYSVLFGMILAMLTLHPACRHKPVYPEVGDAIIDSEPRGAEVIIDGVSTLQMTPCRVSGIAAGNRRLSLCYNNYKTLNDAIGIKPGQTIRRNYRLSQVSLRIIASASIDYFRCLSVDTVHNEVYAATDGSLLRYQITDSSINIQGSIGIRGVPSALAVDPMIDHFFYVGRYATKTSLVCADLYTGHIIREYVQPDSSRYVDLDLSPDGNVLLVADSLGKRILVIDARLGAILKAIPLTGYPRDIVFGDTPAEAFITLCGTKRIARIDLLTGSEREWAPTGNNPRGLFWSSDRRQLGCCNSTDKQLTIVNLGNWSAAMVDGHTVGGVSFPAACWSDDPFYIIVLIKGNGNNGDVGAVDIIYTRNWNFFNKISLKNKGFPIDIAWMPRLRRYLLATDGGLWLLHGDF